MTKTTATGLLLGALGLAVAAPAPLLAADAKNQGYLNTQRDEIVRSGFGLCWRTSDWTPARAVAECDPDLVKKPAPPPKKEVAPPPKPTAPKPQLTPTKPTPKAEPARLLPQKINFSSDALFDFDKAVLKKDAQAMLDDLVRLLDGAKYEVILAIGHTDRIGSDKYNQRLSERRANAVKDYLVKKGIAANRIYAEGKGKKQPVTKPGDCKGNAVSKALIKCLQPDRRVDVEVTGSKEQK